MEILSTYILLTMAVTSTTGQNTAVSKTCGDQSQTISMLQELMEILKDQNEELRQLRQKVDNIETIERSPKLVGFWPLTESSKGSDLSGFGHNANFHDVLYDEACSTCEKVVYFKGTPTSYGVIPGGGSLDVQKSFTWMAWVYLESLDDVPLFNWHDTFRNDYGSLIWVHQQKIHFNTLAGGAAHSSAIPKINQWNRLAVIYNFVGGGYGLYVNGKMQWFTMTAQQMLKTYGDIYIGSRANIPSDPRAAQMKVACMKLYQGIADMNIVETQDPQCPDVWK